MARDHDLYAVLGVGRSATDDEIRTAYRKLARQLHPDVNPDDAQAEERFRQATAAYEVLSDPARRADYDEFGEVALQSGFDAEKARAYRQWQGAGERGGHGFAAGPERIVSTA